LCLSDEALRQEGARRTCGAIEKNAAPNRHVTPRISLLRACRLQADRPAAPYNRLRAAVCVVLSSAKVAMFSLRTQEKLDAERNQDSSRQILWRNLNDRRKSGRMVRRIYNKTRCFGNARNVDNISLTREGGNRNVLVIEDTRRGREVYICMVV